VIINTRWNVVAKGGLVLPILSIDLCVLVLTGKVRGTSFDCRGIFRQRASITLPKQSVLCGRCRSLYTDVQL
jgi:hypothetical protein